MLHSVKLKTGVMLFGAFALPHLASAQIYDGHGFTQNNDLNVQASVTFKIPLGSTDRRRLADQPRLGFGLTLAKNDFDSPLGRRGGERLTLLDVGAYGLKTPSVQFSGQEVYGPTFNLLHANAAAGQTGSKASASSKGGNTKWILLGVAAAAFAVGTSVVINKATENIIEDIEN